MSNKQAAIFFDRDGVINKDSGYVYRQNDFIFNEGIFDLFNYAKQNNFLLLVVTNQSGIARGYYSVEDFANITSYMQNEIYKRLNFKLNKIYFCPHDPNDNCECRKPKDGMIKQACKDYDIDLKNSFLIGDNITDMQAAQQSGIKHKILVGKTLGTTIPKLDNLHIIGYVKEAKEVIERILKS